MMGFDVAQILDVVDRYCPFGELKSTFRSEIGRTGREDHISIILALWRSRGRGGVRVCGDGEDAISADDDGRFQVYQSSRFR